MENLRRRGPTPVRIRLPAGNACCGQVSVLPCWNGEGDNMEIRMTNVEIRNKSQSLLFVPSAFVLNSSCNVVRNISNIYQSRSVWTMTNER